MGKANRSQTDIKPVEKPQSFNAKKEKSQCGWLVQKQFQVAT